MDRKAFLKQTLAIGTASGGAALFGGAAVVQTDVDLAEREQRFKEAWVASLMENLEARFDKKERVELMVDNGRACARRGAIRMAEACRGDVGKLIERLKGIPDFNIETLKESTCRVTYERCFCELVAEGPERLPDTYCECSRGWLLEMFGTAAEKAVEVEIVQTIKRGGSTCEFVLRV